MARGGRGLLLLVQALAAPRLAAFSSQAPGPCSDVATSADSGCDSHASAACYSLEPGAKWACWPADRVPAFMSTAKGADTICKSWPLSEPGFGGKAGAARGLYDGACTFDGKVPKERPRMLSWDEAYAKASDTLLQMTLEEKQGLISGIGWNDPPKWYTRKKWFYVGNTKPVPHLHIPSLNLMDASAGFSLYWHELVGTVTAWPSMLALAATWDPALVKIYATALGNEFAGKGANGILGPQLNVIRPALGGRNMESLSGEDPYLGSRLAEQYVKGVQSQGVLATMKHFVFNEQENQREQYSAEVDDKTAWELYYPPFEAAVKAGVAATMCSYNKVDGVYSCENQKELNQVLKGTMGFRGYVQSDWWATHSTSLAEGLDQEMPGNGGNPEQFLRLSKLKNQSQAVIDEAVKRVLAVMYRMHTESSCSLGKCEKWFQKNVTSAAHRGLARAVAAESIVLLKNDGILPLKAERVSTIAVVGAAADASPYDPSQPGQQHGDWATGDYYTAGGSGHVTAGREVTPLTGIKSRAKAAGIKVLVAASNSTSDALNIAQEADVTIVVAGATAGESRDRAGLNLDEDMDELIDEVAQKAKSTVILLELPGAVLMPWRDRVSGVMAMFLGGEEAGRAWADVLFGDRGPEGRLPVTIPATKEDTIPVSGELTIVYSEGVSTGYRNLQGDHAFTFGHGLSYTHFDFLPPEQVICAGSPREEGLEAKEDAAVVCIDVDLRNSGWEPGKAVAQLYLELAGPASQEVPSAPVLRGFHKTALLQPGDNETVQFKLTRRDLSYYDTDMGAWVISSAVTAHIGASSADIRQRRELHLPHVPLPIEGGFDKDWWNDLLGMAALLGLLGGVVCCHAAQQGSRSDYRIAAWEEHQDAR